MRTWCEFPLWSDILSIVFLKFLYRTFMETFMEIWNAMGTRNSELKLKIKQMASITSISFILWERKRGSQDEPSAILQDTHPLCSLLLHATLFHALNLVPALLEPADFRVFGHHMASCTSEVVDYLDLPRHWWTKRATVLKITRNS